MSLHDKLAQKAAASGKDSSEFTAAAQRHANATWLYAIAAGAVWYFFGWGWALIPAALGVYAMFKSFSSTLIATNLEKTEQASAPDDPEFVRIVHAYGDFLETSAPVPGTVADASKLPYTKGQIKDAIVAALRLTKDPQIKEHLKVGYIQLSEWQEGVGNSDQGFDVSSLNMSQDTEALAETVLEKSEESGKWNALVQREQETLKKELQDLGLW